MKNLSLTDWEKINQLGDEDIDFSDIPETNGEFWKNAEWYMPPKQDSLIYTLKRYNLKSSDVKMIVNLVERLAH